jgi:outer membrane protein assembly factor BamA
MHGKILGALAIGAVSWGSNGDPGNAVTSANVNSRYTVESINVSPVGLSRVSPTLRDRLQEFVGARFDQALLDDAARRLRSEFRNRRVTTLVSKGSNPEQLAVVFQLEMSERGFEVDVTELLYQSKRSFSFGLDLAYRAEANRLHLGALTDNDNLVERYSGVAGGYERSVASGRLKFGAELASWRSQWNSTTEAAAESNQLYRSRTRFTPSATIELFKPLTLQLGVSLERLEFIAPAARYEISSAVTGTLRFQRRWGLDSPSGLRQRFEAAYGLRSGSPSLGSDFNFTRHSGTARYGLRAGNQEILAAFHSGLLTGRAPLAERFIGGNSHILRGWNRNEIAPLGSDALAQVSLDYRWKHLRLAYDAGSVWLRAGGDAPLRQSVAIGFADNLWSGFSFLVAFPLREGRVEPIFIAGMNF